MKSKGVVGMALAILCVATTLSAHSQETSTKKVLRKGSSQPTFALTAKSDASARNKDSVDAAEMIQQQVLQYDQCMSADTHLQIPVKAGQRYVVFAEVAPGRCDPRGWTWDNGVNWVGPLGGNPGIGGNFAPDALMPGVVLGALVGANSSINGGVDETTARQIFAQGAVYVGPHRDDTAKVDGYLYLYMNDNLVVGRRQGITPHHRLAFPVMGAGPPFHSSQLPRVPRPCRVFRDRAGILTSYLHHDSHLFSFPRCLNIGLAQRAYLEAILLCPDPRR